MYRRNIIPVFLAHAFNVKSILCTVNYMIIRNMTMLISNIHNKTPKIVSYIQIYVWKISITELILWNIRLNFVSKNYFRAKIICEQKLFASKNYLRAIIICEQKIFASKNLLWAKIICEQKLNQSVNTSDCQRSEGAEGVLAEPREKMVVEKWS